LSKKDQNKASSTQGWNTYWQGASSSAQAFTSGGASHPGFPLFWSTPLDDFLSARPNARILDIATGSGAVIESLSQLANTRLENVSCVDISEAAIDGVQRRFPGIVGVVADANSIPLETGQYDLVTSQFGIEYAGPAAIDEAVRLLAPDGSLIFLMHIHDGVLYRECSAAIDALRRTRQCGFIQLARDFFELGFAAVRGADRAAYDDAGLKLNPAIQELEAIISDHGQHVAGDMIEYLLTTVQTIHKRIQYHEPDEVLDWLETADQELEKHEERMDSMHQSALDKNAFKAVCENLAGQGLILDRAEPLHLEADALPFAWALLASKSDKQQS